MVSGKKIPVEGGKRTGVFADRLLGIIYAIRAIVAHSVDIAARSAIRLGADDPTIAVLTHSQHVGEGNPVDISQTPAMRPALVRG